MFPSPMGIEVGLIGVSIKALNETTKVFPSPMGIEVGLIMSSSFTMRKRTAQFPSPMGIEVGLIKIMELRQPKDVIVSVPYGD